MAKLEGSTDRAEAVSAAALHSSPEEAEASCATAPSSAQLHEQAVTVLLTTQGQLPPPPRNRAQAGFAHLISHEIHLTTLRLPGRDQHPPSAPKLLMPPMKVSAGLQSLQPAASTCTTASASD